MIDFMYFTFHTISVIILISLIYLLQRARRNELQAASEFFRAAPTAIFVLNQDRCIQHINQAAAQLFGYGIDGLRGKLVSSVVATSPPQEQMLQYALHPPARSSDVCKTEGRCQDGSLFPLELRTKTISQHGHQWIVTAARDLTADIELRAELQRHVDQLVQSKDALQRYNTDLEEIVRLQTSQLETAKNLAEQANAAKSDFLANISHELRTPLHGILSFARLGANKYESVEREKLLRYFQRIETAGQTLLKLLNALLDLSKLESGAMTIQCDCVALAKLATSLVDEFAAIAREKELIIRVRECQSKIYVWADPDKLAQVIRNLLGNAVKFIDRGGEIELILEVQGDRALVSVRDTGPGIPDDECEKVFDKFVQSKHTKTGSGGTGLGLAICREIIELHGGTIRAIPTHGHGALLQFDLSIHTHHAVETYAEEPEAVTV